MRPFAAPLAAVALAFATLTSGCAELDLLLEPTAGGPTTPPMSESPDPAIRAAGASSDTVEYVRDAEFELNKALETKDISHIDKAIKLRPYDSSYHFYRTALLYAEGDDESRWPVFQEMSRGMGLEVRRHEELPTSQVTDVQDQARISSMIGLTDAFAITKTYYPRESEQWRRLNEGYCDMLNDLRSVAGMSLVDEFYSGEDCETNTKR